MKRHLLWLAFSLMIMPHILKAQTIDLVKDINVTGPGTGVIMGERAAAGNMLFFLGSDSAHERQLWRSDGTLGGTRMLTDISYDLSYPPQGLFTANGLAFCQFQYNKRFWLFRSDGTTAGTFPLVELPFGLPDGHSVLEANGSVYFSNAGPDGSRQLWKTDGTVAGTTMVKEVVPTGSNSVGPLDLFNFNSILYFLIGVGNENGSTDYQLWKSDGTTAGTVPGPAMLGRFRPASVNGYMYFSENNSLKRTDGNTVTTIKSFSYAGDPVVVGATLYFSAQDGTTGTELWKSNGTTAGTVLVKDINPGTNAFSMPHNLINVNGTLFFAALSGMAGDTSGYRLWKSNGTTAGTEMIIPSAWNVNEVIAVGNQVAFSGRDPLDASKIWVTDGTNAGTKVLADFFGNLLINVGGTLFFRQFEPTIRRVFKSNLTPEGTVPVSPWSGPGSEPHDIFDLDGTGYFAANDGTNTRELWKTDKSTGGTVLIKDFLIGTFSLYPEQFTNVNGTLYFVSNDGMIWKSNGTPEGTVLVKNMVQMHPYHKTTGLIGLGNTLFFFVYNAGAEKLELWKSDGTSAGTVHIKTFSKTNLPDCIKSVVLNGLLYFLAWDGINSYELWKSNGTAAGTSLVKDISERGGAIGSPLILNNNIYYILGSPDENSTQLLVKSDGTAKGTNVIKTRYPDDEFIYTSDLFTAGNLVYFDVFSSSQEKELLWRTDGTEAGTFRLADFDFVGNLPNIRHKTNVGGKLFFVPYDDETGEQLWVSDGTPSGTHMVKRIGSGMDKITISHSAAVGNVFYFTPNHPATGTELWRSDGTSEGTYLVYDLTSGRSGTRFFDLANVGGTLLISADAGKIGAELYRYQPAMTALRINSGGAAFAASGNRPFSTDQYFSGATRISNAAGGDILNTTDDQLFKEQRTGPAFSYNLPVSNGPMQVVLHFAEIYWGVPGRGGSNGTGKRRFHVDIEGSRKLKNYDIFSAAGGAMRAQTESFMVNVTDGILNIDFLAGTADQPMIAAIEVLPVQVDLGPLADAFVRNKPNDNTSYGTAETLQIKAGSLPAYQRNTYLKFPLNGISEVSSAKLRLYGSNVQSGENTSVAAYGVSDDSWIETDITWNNAPVFSGSALGSVNVNGSAEYYEIDVTPFIKSELAGDKVASLVLTNPDNQNARLIFNSRESKANRPQLIIRSLSSPTARMGEEADFVIAENEPEVSGIYPNPVTGKHFSVKVSERHKGDITLSLINKTGASLLIRNITANAIPVVEMDVSGSQLPAGAYLFKIESMAHKEVLKLLVSE
ncbi:ELWxxDGT repeat protein [Dyadobacter sp. NIV53]|uniref:ELWxxDGT repeat protein n=1 Tax=Dyadobacter sp. NIV53 TaxID=2861765 RepID=UPI001C874D54|nr:ELWxxDGT repeat protein [Dyadobacter sp. NIV53]